MYHIARLCRMRLINDDFSRNFFNNCGYIVTHIVCYWDDNSNHGQSAEY